MNKNEKQIRPMLCPVCKRFEFTPLSEKDIEEGKTPNDCQCRHCGWHYDVEQTEYPDWAGESNEMSLNEYREWYKKKRKANPKWEYFQEMSNKPGPHPCPICGLHNFPEPLSYDICPYCSYLDNGDANEWTMDLDWKPESGEKMSINEMKAWFAAKRAEDPNYTWLAEVTKTRQQKKKKKRKKH